MNNEKERAEFRNAKLGLFVHFGLYSVLGRGEWVMCRERISAADYEKLTEQFHPSANCIDGWCRMAKQTGMKYMVLTTRHHDGFALFDSKACSFNSMHAPCHRDFVAEYVKACRKYGLKIGLYFSLGNWRYGIMKESDSKEKAEKMRDLTYAQIRELMTNYGKIDILWYDGAWCYPSKPEDTMADVERFWRGKKLNEMVRSLQPHILINDRAGDPADIRTGEGSTSGLNDKQLCEVCFTLGRDANSYWGYFRGEALRKTNAELMQIMVQACCGGFNLLLNVGPDAAGVIPPWQKKRVQTLGKWVLRNQEAVYGVVHTDVSTDVNGLSGNAQCRLSEKNGILYCYFTDYPYGSSFIPIMKEKIVKAELMDGTPLKFTMRDRGILLEGFPAKAPDPDCVVCKLYTDRNKMTKKQKGNRS